MSHLIPHIGRNIFQRNGLLVSRMTVCKFAYNGLRFSLTVLVCLNVQLWSFLTIQLFVYHY